MTNEADITGRFDGQGRMRLEEPLASHTFCATSSPLSSSPDQTARHQHLLLMINEHVSSRLHAQKEDGAQTILVGSYQRLYICSR